MSDGDIALDADDVQLQVVCLLEQSDNLLLFRCEVRKQLTLHSLRFLLHRLPTQTLQQVLCRCDEGCRIVANHLVATLAERHSHSARECKDVTSILLCNATSDEASTLDGALDEDGGIRHTCHNTVALAEIVGQGLRLTHILRQQSSLRQHLYRIFTVVRRIYLVQTVSQHSDCLESLFKGITMGADINAVCQSADNQHLRTQYAEVCNEPSDKILSVGGAMTRSHDVYHMPLIEVGTTFVIE